MNHALGPFFMAGARWIVLFHSRIASCFLLALHGAILTSAPRSPQTLCLNPPASNSKRMAHLGHHASNGDGVFALREMLVSEVEGTNDARSD